MYSPFFASTFTWNPNDDNYGLVAETEGHKRSASALRDDLVAFIQTVAGYLPHSYVTQRMLTTTTCMEDVFDIIADIYEAEINSLTFMDLALIRKDSKETYRTFYCQSRKLL